MFGREIKTLFFQKVVEYRRLFEIFQVPREMRQYQSETVA